MSRLTYGISTDGEGSWAISRAQEHGVWEEVEHAGKFYTFVDRGELTARLLADDDANGIEWDAGRLEAFTQAEARLEKAVPTQTRRRKK